MKTATIHPTCDGLRYWYRLNAGTGRLVVSRPRYTTIRGAQDAIARNHPTYKVVRNG
jgi:hypothetical protein